MCFCFYQNQTNYVECSWGLYTNNSVSCLEDFCLFRFLDWQEMWKGVLGKLICWPINIQMQQLRIYFMCMKYDICMKYDGPILHMISRKFLKNLGNLIDIKYCPHLVKGIVYDSHSLFLGLKNLHIHCSSVHRRNKERGQRSKMGQIGSKIMEKGPKLGLFDCCFHENTSSKSKFR